MTPEPCAVAAYDQALAAARDAHPGHSRAWYEAWLQRTAWYVRNGGDMAGAPDLPDDAVGEPC